MSFKMPLQFPSSWLWLMGKIVSAGGGYSCLDVQRLLGYHAVFRIKPGLSTFKACAQPIELSLWPDSVLLSVYFADRLGETEKSTIF